MKSDLKFENTEKRKQDFEEKMRGKQGKKQQREEDSRKRKQHGPGEASGSGLTPEKSRRGGGDQDMEVAEPAGEKRLREDRHAEHNGDTMHDTAMLTEPGECDEAKGSGRGGTWR